MFGDSSDTVDFRRCFSSGMSLPDRHMDTHSCHDQCQEDGQARGLCKRPTRGRRMDPLSKPSKFGINPQILV
jgi:hypothetical protein